MGTIGTSHDILVVQNEVPSEENHYYHNASGDGNDPDGFRAFGHDQPPQGDDHM
jgi:hypothetical protein